MPLDSLECFEFEAYKWNFPSHCSIKMCLFRKDLAVRVKTSRLVPCYNSLWIFNNMVCGIVECVFFVSPIVIIPLIRFPSLARPINFWWHLSEWNKWNDWFPSFVERVRHDMTYVGSLPYLEPIIWWVGRQPTNAGIRVLKSHGAKKRGWRSHPIWLKFSVLV